MNGAPLAIVALVLTAFAAGAGLGWLFYAGLYRTVRALAHTRRPALLVLVSMLLRMLVLLGGLLALLLVGEAWTQNGWAALLPALLGVVAMRTRLLRRYGRPGAQPQTGPGAGDNADTVIRPRRSASK